MSDGSLESLRRDYSRALRAARIGREAVIVESTGSTNRDILTAASQGAAEGLLICADSQQCGRGRQGRQWHSPSGRNLYFSLLLRPKMPANRIPQIAMLAALALRRGITTLLPEAGIALKWPNDLWINGRKLSGILCECGENGAIALGIGLNVNSTLEDFPEELRENAISLRMALAPEARISRGELLGQIANAFETIYHDWLTSADFMPFIREWEQYDLLKGRVITISRPADELKCRVLCVDGSGFLKVETLPEGRTTLIAAGDVHIGHL